MDPNIAIKYFEIKHRKLIQEMYSSFQPYWKEQSFDLEFHLTKRIPYDDFVRFIYFSSMK